MRSWAFNLAAATLFLGVAGSAFATPPQAVSVTDTLFARTQDTVFLLREVHDNHGLHSVLQTDTMVVFKSLERGDDRGFRMVARVVDYGTDGDPRVVVRGPTDPFNPYTLHADFGAWPIGAFPFGLPDGASLSQNGIRIDTHDYFGPASYHLPLVDVATSISSALGATRFFAPLERVGGGTTGPDPFDPLLFAPLEDCTLGNVRMLFDYPGDPALAQVSCRDEDETQSATLWLIVPRVTE